MTAPFRQTLTDRELRWLRHIAVHGPQSSELLLELCADTHRCRDTGLRTLQKLRDSGFLRLPPQQRQIAKADFNPYVYDLTRQGELHLRGLGDPPTVRPTGHWWHGFLTASVSSAITIEAQRKGFRYISAHEILARNGASLAIPYGRTHLIPDQFFALDYGGSFRSFVLEVDRGTEPYRSKSARKSIKGMLQTFADLTAKDAIRAHYALKSPLLVLLVFASSARAARCLELIESDAPALAPYALVSVVPEGFPKHTSVAEAVSGEWRRAVKSRLCLFG